MIVEAVHLRRLQMPLRDSFAASYGAHPVKHGILVQLETDVGLGFAECSAFADPYYTEETVDTAWLMIERYLVPALKGKSISEAEQASSLWDRVRGNNMAKASLESAVWDVLARQGHASLASALGGTAGDIPVGISLGLYESEAALLSRVETALEEGYQRVKVKIAPGSEHAILKSIRDEFGAIALSADANGAYTKADAALLQSLDDYGLVMLEQPLAFDDLHEHAELQRTMATPICLDESIRSVRDASSAIAMGACRAICVKPSRVGGLSAARDIVALCETSGLPAWCGGMYETGVGRLHCMALCTLPGMTMPGDIGPSSRYYEEDIVDPPIEFSRPGWLSVGGSPGQGAQINSATLARFTVAEKRL